MRDSRHPVLESALEAIDRLRLYTEEGRELFLGDPLVQEGVCRNLQIVRDVCHAETPHLIERFQLLGPNSPVLSLCSPEQDYYEAGLAMAWSSLEEELSDLRAAVQEAMESST